MSLVVGQDYRMIPSGIIVYEFLIYEFLIYEFERQLQTNSLGGLHLKINATIPGHLFL